MDELIKFLTSKIGYTLTFIFGCLLPGNIMIFALDRQLYLQIDIIKLFFSIVWNSSYDFYTKLYFDSSESNDKR